MKTLWVSASELRSKALVRTGIRSQGLVELCRRPPAQTHPPDCRRSDKGSNLNRLSQALKFNDGLGDSSVLMPAHFQTAPPTGEINFAPLLSTLCAAYDGSGFFIASPG